MTSSRSTSPASAGGPRCRAPPGAVPGDALRPLPRGAAEAPDSRPSAARSEVAATGSAHDAEGASAKPGPETLRRSPPSQAKVHAHAEELEPVRSRRRDGARDAARLLRRLRTGLPRGRAGPRPRGHAVGLLEVLSLFPVPAAALRGPPPAVERVVVVEENGTGLTPGGARPTSAAPSSAG